ncbi:MAG TPA: hypothetical protein VGO93_02885 [Candidatus Xenobia bacterium]|jgi:hypothetical protein
MHEILGRWLAQVRRFHTGSANDDARRTWGLGLPRRGYSLRQVLHPSFVDFVLADLQQL